MILFIDNYDSFVHNLARYFRQLTDQPMKVVRNDAINVNDISESISAIVISPGPCGPSQAGACLEIVKTYHQFIPILGVCLGHQILIEALGGTVVQSKQPTHGKSSLVNHDKSDLFHNIPNPFKVGRYHSLIGEKSTLPEEFVVTAKTADDVLMAVRHSKFATFGVQFHPESVLTEHGYRLVGNFLNIAGIKTETSTGRIFA